MSSRTTGRCPSRDDWSAFLRGVETDRSAESLAAHLEDCPVCLAEVDTIGQTPVPGLDALRGAMSTGLPDRIGPFAIRGVLGEGGFGRVYLAVERRSKRTVALKVPRDASLVDATARARFEVEGVAASKLDHPNIVPIYSVGESGGLPYIASKYCAGPTLANWIEDRAGFLPFRLAAAIAAGLAEGLEHAHAKGVLHRDVSPLNVMLDKVDGPDAPDPIGIGFIPRLTDFGLAKVADDGAGPRLSRAGEAAGTAEFMAPEQVDGRGGPVDARADVHAVGAVLYQLLTGRLPYRGETRAETLGLIVRGEPIAPSRLRDGLPRDLAVIVQHCLETARDRRYPTAGALADDLRRFLEGRPIVARPVGPATRLAKWARRRPALAASLAMTAVAIVAVGLILVASNRRLSAALDVSRARNRAIRQRLYAEDVHQGWIAFQAGEVAWARELLDRALPEPGDGPEDDFRGFEWHYLAKLARSEPREIILRGHPAGVGDVKYAPDGSTIVTAGLRDGSIKVWNPQGGVPLRSLDGHRGDVNRLAFSPDGLTIASAGDDRTARVWEVATGRTRFILDGHDERVFDVLYSPDGRLIATSGVRQDIRLWDADDGRRLGTVPILGRQARALAFVPGGRRLVGLFDDGFLRVWDLTHPDRPEVIATGQSAPSRMVRLATDIAFYPNGPYFATSGGLDVEFWDSATWQNLRRVGTHQDSPTSVAFSPDGTYVAGGGRDRTIRIWRNDGPPYTTLAGHEGPVTSLAFSPDGRSIASASLDGSARIWDWHNDRIVPGRQHSPRFAWGAATENLPELIVHSPSRDLLAIAVEDSGFRIIDRADARDVFRPPASGARPATALAFSTDGERLAVAGPAGRAMIWDTRGFRPVADLLLGSTPVHVLRFSPDGRTLAAAIGTHPAERRVELWDWQSARRRASLPSPATAVRCLAYAPDGRTLAVAGSDGSLRFWDGQTGQVATIRSPTGIMMIVYSPDGRTLAVAGTDETITLREIPSLRIRATLRRRSGRSMSLVFSPDGKTLVAAHVSGGISFWQASTGLLLFDDGRLDDRSVVSIAFAPDGRSLVTALVGVDSCELDTWPLGPDPPLR